MRHIGRWAIALVVLMATTPPVQAFDSREMMRVPAVASMSMATGWSQWESLGGQLAERPIAVTRGSQSLDVFAVGTDRSVWNNEYDASGWHWSDFYTYSSSQLGAAANASAGAMALYERNGDAGHPLSARLYRNSSWGAWMPAGGQLASEPTAIQWPNNADAFVEGTDAHLWMWTGSWQLIGGLLSAAPAAVGIVNTIQAQAQNEDVVFVRGTDTSLWYWSSRSGWHSGGGRLAGKPAAACATSGGTQSGDAYVQGLDGALWHFTSSTGRWEDIGGKIIGPPSVVALCNTSFPVDVFVEGTDHGVWHATYNGISWQWEPLGGYITDPPSAVSWSAGRFDVFARGGDGALWHRFFQ